jgi:hypothetical protein
MTYHSEDRALELRVCHAVKAMVDAMPEDADVLIGHIVAVMIDEVRKAGRLAPPREDGK